MAVPFTTGRVCRFLALWLLAIAAVYGLFVLLTHVRGRQSIVPHSSHLSKPPDPSGATAGDRAGGMLTGTPGLRSI